MLARNTNNKWYMMLESGTSIDVIRDELRQGVHRPERLNLKKTDRICSAELAF